MPVFVPRCPILRGWARSFPADQWGGGERSGWAGATAGTGWARSTIAAISFARHDANILWGMNRLSAESSRYLRQHADQPIDWWPWCDEAFEEARRRDVPVLVSIGYSSCHWCHAMAEENFSAPVVGAFLNEHFVAIKVDRDERPDVDQVFMSVTQALTGQGGWPNTVICTPEGNPFFAGTYFPPKPGPGMPSFSELLSALAKAWSSRRDEVMASGQTVVQELAAQQAAMPAAGLRDEYTEPARLMTMLRTSFDPVHGGFGGAPKFPHAAVIDAMLVCTEALSNDHGLFTLESMARGGICDQVGGGFHRYSVDDGWEVPHFEKMLYDNALLLGSYTRGWLRATPGDGTEQRELFERVVRSIVSWLGEEMMLPAGGFAASLDADSPNEEGDSEEGAYYLWTPQQFDEYLGRDSRFAQGVFHLTHGGNLPAGAHAPTDGTGRSTLQLHGNPHPGRLANVLSVLREVRRARVAPIRDDTVITAWNGLLVDSLVHAAMVFGEPEWLDMARRAGDYLWATHYDPQRQVLARTSLADGDEVSLGPNGVLVGCRRFRIPLHHPASAGRRFHPLGECHPPGGPTGGWCADRGVGLCCLG